MAHREGEMEEAKVGRSNLGLRIVRGVTHTTLHGSILVDVREKLNTLSKFIETRYFNPV